MKKYTEYQTLTPLEVAEIGERDGWPIDGMAVSDDGNRWEDEGGIKAAGEQFQAGGSFWNYCARPVERIEWEKVADSLDDYYDAKRQTSTITPEMIEKVLRTLPDCRGLCWPVNGWHYPSSDRAEERADLVSKFAAALNGQLSEKAELEQVSQKMGK